MNKKITLFLHDRENKSYYGSVRKRKLPKLDSIIKAFDRKFKIIKITDYIGNSATLEVNEITVIN